MPENPLLLLKIGEAFTFDSNYIKKLHLNRNLIADHIETVFSEAGYPEKEREKNNLIIYEKVKPGHEIYKFTKIKNGYEMLRITQAMGIWAVDPKGKVLRDVVFRNEDKDIEQLNRLRRPAKTVSIEGLLVTQLKKLGAKILQEELLMSNEEMGSTGISPIFYLLPFTFYLL